jgi:hypothetical protein
MMYRQDEQSSKSVAVQSVATVGARYATVKLDSKGIDSKIVDGIETDSLALREGLAITEGPTLINNMTTMDAMRVDVEEM